MLTWLRSRLVYDLLNLLNGLQLCLQLLEGIGAIYGAAMVDEENEDFEETISMPLDPSETIISAVDKVCIRALSFHLTVLLTSF